MATNRATTRKQAGPKAKPRLQLEFTEDAYSRLAELKHLTGARTNAEVIRKALHVLDWIVTRTKTEQYRIQLVKGEEKREVEMVGMS